MALRLAPAAALRATAARTRLSTHTAPRVTPRCLARLGRASPPLPPTQTRNMTAAVSAAAMQAKLEEDMAALVDNFEGLLRCAQARARVRHRRFQALRRCVMR